MITIGTSRIEEIGETAFLRAPVEVSPDTAREYARRVSELTNAGWLVREDYPPRAWSAGGGELWFSVPAEFGRYLCTERSNAFVVAMLWYALVAESDIIFEAPLSKRLYDGIVNRLMPELQGNGLAPIQLIGPITSEPVVCAGGVATGMSGGVDSLYTLHCYGSDDAPEGMRLTHLTYYTGNFRYPLHPDGRDNQTLFRIAESHAEPIIQNARQKAQHAGLPFILTNSNLDADYYRGGLIYTVMYRNAAYSLALEHLHRVYISSSSGHAHGVYEVSLFSPTQHYEDLLCDCLRTETFRYMSSDQATRVEKLRVLADDEGAQRFVAVCYAPSEDDRNCGECYGCWKTVVPLDLLGKLDLFSETFDVPQYQRNRARVFEDFIRFSLRPEASSARESVRQILALAESDPSEAGDLFLQTYRSVMKA